MEMKLHCLFPYDLYSMGSKSPPELGRTGEWLQQEPWKEGLPNPNLGTHREQSHGPVSTVPGTCPPHSHQEAETGDGTVLQIHAFKGRKLRVEL